MLACPRLDQPLGGRVGLNWCSGGVALYDLDQAIDGARGFPIGVRAGR